MNVVLTVGNNMMGDDGAGPMLYQLLQDNPLENWQALDGGAIPENQVHIIRALKPNRVVIVDATDMDLKAGEIRLIDKEIIADMFIASTHNLPLNFLIEQIEQEVEEVIFIGIQPDIVSFMFPITPAVQQGVEQIYQALKQFEQEGLPFSFL